MKDRFDLEQEIMGLCGYIDQINLIKAAVDSENNKIASQALEGLAAMLELYREKLSDTMCQVLRLDEYREIDI